MKSYYDLMTIGAEDYSDPLSLQTQKFTFSEIPLEILLTEKDIERVDNLIYQHYQTSEYYDVILDINNVGHIKDFEPGHPLLLPVRADIENFYAKYKVK